ncbi:MAG: hypothetical protein JOZ69_21140, partial [Myxococcales bacterium]|nr:hypothetical protein [Myxococcales bacterium]
MVSPAAVAPPVAGDLFAPYEVVRELGARPNPVYAVRQPDAAGRPRLLVAEAFAGAGTSTDPAATAFVAAARRISTLANPNLSRARELVVRGEDLVAFWEFIDGEMLAGIWPSPEMPLEISVRLVLDVLSGVGALHGVRDAKQQPMALSHGEVSPATVVLGVDGMARVLHAIARRVPGMPPESASLGYLAPEVRAGEDYDARADVYGAGVLLWEALSGRRLFGSRHDSASPDAPPPASVPETSAWAKGLIPVVARALALAPDGRWPTAAAMALEIRRVVGLKVAPSTAAATFARTAIGERVERRRQALEGSPAGPRPSAAPPPLGRAVKGAAPPPVASAAGERPAAREPSRPDRSRRDPSGPDAPRREPSRPELLHREASRPELPRRSASRPELPEREPSRAQLRQRGPSRPDLAVREASRPDAAVREPSRPDGAPSPPSAPRARPASAPSGLAEETPSAPPTFRDPSSP